MTDNSFPFFSADTIPAGQRLTLAIEYDGALFHGWQLQKHCVDQTVQGCLEKALAKIADTDIRVHCAGRTDAGVHASQQIAHFDVPCDRSLKAWVMGTNAHLPNTVAVKWAAAVDKEFHARFSASYRRYRYIIYNSAFRSPVLNTKATWEKAPLDEALMHREAQSLIGELDFSGFRAASCQSTTPMRCVHHIHISRQGELVIIDIQANAFLHHMVRNIAGVLMDVGSGRRQPGWTESVLLSKDRRCGSVTALPDGLYLVDVGYSEHFQLPKPPLGPAFLGVAGA